MRTLLRSTLLAFLLCLGSVTEGVCLYAQIIVPREVYLSWDDFVAEFLDQSFEQEEESPELSQKRQAVLDRLENIYNEPLNINVATRQELLELEFLTSEQADSVLSTRKRFRMFSSPGDLMTVRGLGYQERRWLSLFVMYGDTIQSRNSRWKAYYEGRHTIESRWEIPLYKRAGYQFETREALIKNRKRAYLGAPFAHTLRYRYNWKNQMMYGVTLQKDSGEPFGAYGQYPYDHVSGFFSRSSKDGKGTWMIGDYRLHIGQGLLLGHGYFFNPSQTALQLSHSEIRLLPHTGTDEVRFFRGGAGMIRRGSWNVLTFVSHRRLDGRLENDTLRSFITNGLHRSLTEIERKGAVGVTSIGIHGEWRSNQKHIGVSALYLHYDHVIFPSLRPYNTYAFRGQTTGGISLDASWREPRWAWQGELAFDAKGHPAFTNIYRRHILRKLNGSLQLRYFSPQYTSPYGFTWQGGNQIQDEIGVTFALNYRLKAASEIRGFLDYHYHQQPAFRAYDKHDGWRGQVEWEWTKDKQCNQFRYTHISRQYNIVGHSPFLEYVTTHRLRWQSRYQLHHLEWQWAVDASIHHQQTRTKPHFGSMLSARASWHPNDRWRISGFASFFATHDYATRLYAYVPQLRGVSSFPSFSDQGMSVTLMALCTLNRHWGVSGRWNINHYFNRDYIASGMQRINSPTQSDLGFYLRYKF